MIPIASYRSASRRDLVSRRVAKSMLLLPFIGCVLALSSCEGEGALPGLEITADTKPVGEGLKVIGFAVIGASVIIVIGRMLK